MKKSCTHNTMRDQKEKKKKEKKKKKKRADSFLVFLLV